MGIWPKCKNVCYSYITLQEYKNCHSLVKKNYDAWAIIMPSAILRVTHISNSIKRIFHMQPLFTDNFDYLR